MEEYEVRDVARRSDSPDLYLDFRFIFGGGNIQVHPRITNRSTEPALYASVRLYAESALDLQGNAKWSLLDNLEVLWDNKDRFMFRVARFNWSVPERHPILEGEYYDLPHINLACGALLPNQVHRFNFGWEVRAPRAAPHLCGRKLTLDRNGAHFEPDTHALDFP
jgi:hypothetical protein